MNDLIIWYPNCEKDKAGSNPVKKQGSPKILLTLSYKRVLNSKDNQKS